MLFLLVFGIYAIWDSGQTASQSLPGEFEVYKPDPWDGPVFPDLKEVNPEVIGWITIYGTNIDYPLVQGDDNEKYVKTAADGTYSLGGSIFLDSRNSADLTDFNSVIYGHSMAYNAMFGDISDYLDAGFFAEHGTGDIFINEKHMGLQILAILETDAYKSGLYHIPVSGAAEKKAYIDEINEFAVHTMGGDTKGWDDFYAGSREGKGVFCGKIGDHTIGADDRLAILSTCTFRMTNGRHILVCRICDEVFEDPYKADPPRRSRMNFDAVGPENANTRLFWIVLIIILVLSAAVYITGRANRKAGLYLSFKQKGRKGSRKRKDGTEKAGGEDIKNSTEKEES